MAMGISLGKYWEVSKETKPSIQISSYPARDARHWAMQGDCLAGKPIDAIGQEVEGDCEVAAHGP